VKSWAQAAKSGDSYRLFSLETGEPLSSGAEVCGVMMSRPDFDVHVVKLPGLPEAEIEGFLRYRMRALYPGQPEETAYDYQILGRNGQRLAVLFLTRAATLEAYREAAGGRPLFLPFSLFRSLCRKNLGGRSGYAYWGDSWIDVMVSTRDEPCRARLLKRTEDPGGDLERLRELMPLEEGEGRWVLLCSRADCEGLREAAGALETAGYRVSVTALEELPAAGKAGEPLFAPRRRRRLPPLRIRLQAYAALLLVLGFFALKLSADRDLRYLERLQAAQAQLQARTAGTAALRQESTGLEEQLEALRGRRPADPYLVLSELTELLPPGSRIQSFVMEGRRFQLEAVGSNPLGLMEGFNASALLGRVKLSQIVPLQDSGRELFKITGVLND